MYREIISKGDYALAITETFVCFHSNKSHAYASLFPTAATVNVTTYITGTLRKTFLSPGEAEVSMITLGSDY
jgi:hypothetical protein